MIKFRCIRSVERKVRIFNILITGLGAVAIILTFILSAIQDDPEIHIYSGIIIALTITLLIQDYEPAIGYREISGDLLEYFESGIFDVMGHGCNCQKSMSGGIALQISQRYPSVKENDIGILGSFSRTLIHTPHGRKCILNIYTQIHPGPDFRIESLRSSLREINREFKGQHIGLPQIGSGIGGGDWDEIKSVIMEELKDMSVTIVVYRKKKSIFTV